MQYLNKSDDPSNSKWAFLEKPIFILGTARSGTTLMQSLLDYHDQILSIPAELHYYLDWKMVTGLYGTHPPLEAINKYFFDNTDIGHFGGLVPVGAGMPYDTTAINPNVFRQTLLKASLQTPNSKQYLQLLVQALVWSNPVYKQNVSRFKYFLCCMNVFHIPEILYDFPEAKIIIMDRDKAEVYVSQKKFWIKNFRSYYVTSYKNFPKYHFKKSYVIQMILEYILTGIRSRNRYKHHPNVLIIDHFMLIHRTQKTLDKIVDWLGIHYTGSLNLQTMCGKLYTGNLSSMKNTGGIIIKEAKDKIRRQELSRIEYWCLKKIMPNDIKDENISRTITRYKYNCLTLILEAMKLLPYESIIKSKKLLLRFPITYFMNRLILLRHLFTAKRTDRTY